MLAVLCNVDAVVGVERFLDIIDFTCRDDDKKFLIFVSGHIGGEFVFLLYYHQHHGLK